MPSFGFKFRPQARTVYLVRHRYDKTKRRSRCIVIARLDRAADPDGLPDGLDWLVEEPYSDIDLAYIAEWLRKHGDLHAAEARRKLALRIEGQLRAARDAERINTNAFDGAIDALNELQNTLLEMAAAESRQGVRAWGELRPQYRAVLAAWNRAFEAARAAGLIKRTRRGSVAAGMRKHPAA